MSLQTSGPSLRHRSLGFIKRGPFNPRSMAWILFCKGVTGVLILAIGADRQHGRCCSSVACSIDQFETAGGGGSWASWGEVGWCGLLMGWRKKGERSGPEQAVTMG
jgi:hypothetical protein